jgi:hypothetical protein
MKAKLFLLLLIVVLTTSLAGCTRVLTEDVTDSIGAPLKEKNLQTVVADISPVSSDNLSANQTIILKNPTFAELKAFVLTDDTHRHQFIENVYECRHFATDMVNNAVDLGLNAGFVLICYNQGQHAVVAFNTIDRGLIYIEPQTNASIDVKVGGYYQDRLIKEILIAW